MGSLEGTPLRSDVRQGLTPPRSNVSIGTSSLRSEREFRPIPASVGAFAIMPVNDLPSAVSFWKRLGFDQAGGSRMGSV